MAKTQKKSGYGIEFYTEFSRMEKNAKMIAKTSALFERKLKVWFSNEGGFLFNEKAAINLSNFLKKSLTERNRESFSSFMGNVQWWTDYKDKKGWDTRQGLATHAAANSIDHIRSGYSEYRVGWLQKASASPSAGKEKRIAQYMEWLEFGRPAAPKTGEQPPRPWFGLSVKVWFKTVFPNFLRTIVGQDFDNFYTSMRKAGVQVRRDYVRNLATYQEKGTPSFDELKSGYQNVGESGASRIKEVKARDDLLGKSKIIGQAKIGGEWYDVTDENIVKKGGAIKGVFDELYDMIEDFRSGLDRGE